MSEDVFEYYFHLPTEIRMMINNETNVVDRCKLSQCSRLCHAEIQVSKKFRVYELRLCFQYDKYVTIDVIPDEYSKNSEKMYGFRFEFSNVGRDEKYIRVQSLNYKQSSEVELDDSIEIMHYGFEHFKKILHNYQKTIKKISINGDYIWRNDTYIRELDFEIERLDSLEELTLHERIDFQQFLSKIKRPLKVLCLQSAEENTIADNEQIYQVENCLISHHTKLTNDQFLRLSASFVSIHIGHLTERNIFDFVRAWQCGSLSKPVERYEWRLTRSNFNILELFNLMGDVYDGISRTKTIQVNQFHEHGKRAKLTYKKIIERRWRYEYVRSEHLVFSVLKN